MFTSIAKTLTQKNTLRKYIAQCRTRHGVEAEDVHVPPSMEEIEELISYLSNYGVKAIIVGSAAILMHLGPEADTSKDFRPTSDLDLFVSKPPPKQLPIGWKRDPETIGVPSWISPTGGYVDFLEGGYEFPGGRKNPKSIGVDPMINTGVPVADVQSLFKLKLNSERNKDLLDLVTLARKTGIPKDLGKLNRQQQENLQMLEQWIKFKPSGNYGE